MYSNVARGIALLVALSGCSGENADVACIPGATQQCVGAGGCAGGQVCAEDGARFLACDCGDGMDAGVVGRDGGGSDGGGSDSGGSDGGGSDAGPVDASDIDGAMTDAGRSDAGPPMCVPACDPSARCCGAACVSRTGTAIGLDGRDDPAFANCNECGLTCDAMTASACSVATGTVMPRCMCGTGGPCTLPQTCQRQGDRFECQCGSRGPCPFGTVCGPVGGENVCQDIRSDPMNCGELGHECPAGAVCSGGSCRCGASRFSTCDSPNVCCGTECVDTLRETAHCGRCDNQCAFGEACITGTCGCGTADVHCDAPGPGALGEACCDGTCVGNSDASCMCRTCDLSMGRSCAWDSAFERACCETAPGDFLCMFL